MYRQSEKNLLSSNISATCELRPTSGWDCFVSLGHPCKFQRVSRLGSCSARHSSSGRLPNFAALNWGRHLYWAGRPSRWALAHIFGSFYFILGIAPSPHWWTDFDNLYVMWCVSVQGSAFWGSRWHCSPFGGHMPQNSNFFGAWIGIFKPKLRNSKTYILSKLLYRFQPNFAWW